MGRKQLMRFGAGAGVIVIVFVALLLSRGDDGVGSTAAATDAASATVPTPTTATPTTATSPIDSAPAETPATSGSTASAAVPAPAPAKSSNPAPKVDSFARFAHPPTANGTAGSTSGTNKYKFPVDQISPASSEVRVHVSGQAFSESVLCLRPDGATVCQATWTAPSHNITVSYYLTVEPMDEVHYRAYRSATLTFNVP